MRLMWSLMRTGVPGLHAGLRPPQPLVSTMVEQPGGLGGADAVHDGAHAAALVEVGAGAEDEGAPAGVTDGDRAHAARVARDGGGVEARDVGVLDGRERLADEVGRSGPSPSRARGRRRGVATPVRSRDDGGGGGGDVEGVGGGVGEVVGSGSHPTDSTDAARPQVRG